MAQDDWLRALTDKELQTIAQELHDRAEQFSPDTRMRVNDELRRRKMPTVGVGRSRM